MSGFQAVARLVDIAERHRLPDPQRSGIGGLGARDHAEQGRLARAVRPDHSDDAAGREPEVQPVDQHPLAVPLGQAPRLDDQVAQPGSGGDDDLRGLRRPVVGFGEQRLVSRDSRLALGLARPRRGADPFELARQGAATRRFAFFLLGQPLLLLVQPGGIVALPGDAPAAVELENPARDVVEEVAIVRDRDDGAGIVVQEPFEPGDRFGVQMIGRLVEQQQVRPAQQETAESDPAPLAARQRRHIGVAGRAAHRVHRDLDLAIDIPGVRRVDPFLERALLLDQGVHRLLVQRLGEPRAHLLETRQQVADPGDALDDVLLNGLRGVERRFLRQMAHADRIGGPGLAPILRFQPRHDPQQGGLAGAVEPEHADLGAEQEGQRDVVQHVAPAAVAHAEPAHYVDILRGAHGTVRPSLFRRGPLGTGGGPPVGRDPLRDRPVAERDADLPPFMTDRSRDDPAVQLLEFVDHGRVPDQVRRAEREGGIAGRGLAPVDLAQPPVEPASGVRRYFRPSTSARPSSIPRSKHCRAIASDSGRRRRCRSATTATTCTVRSDRLTRTP